MTKLIQIAARRPSQATTVERRNSSQWLGEKNSVLTRAFDMKSGKMPKAEVRSLSGSNYQIKLKAIKSDRLTKTRISRVDERQ